MKLAKLFCDSMVLQRDKTVYIFGTGEGRGSITFLGEIVTVESTDDRWEAAFAPHPAGGPYEITGELNGQPFRISNVMIGEVWIAGGQSNMEFALKNSENYEDYLFETDAVRYYTVGTCIYNWEDTPWVACNKENATEFSAIGHYFAHALQKKLGVTVGIISTNVGATCIQAWTDKELINGTWPDLPTKIRSPARATDTGRPQRATHRDGHDRRLERPQQHPSCQKAAGRRAAAAGRP